MFTLLGKKVAQMARKMPPTRFPDAVAVTYYRSIKKLVREMGRITLIHFDGIIRFQAKSYQADAGELNIIQQTLDIIKALSLTIFKDERILDIALTFVNGLNLFNMKNMNDQARVAGVNPIQFEPWIDEYIQTSVKQNVSYISSIRDSFFSKIEAIVYEGVKNGSSTKAIREQLVKQFGMSEARAQFIAIDQSGSIFGQLTAKRHEDMGVNKFKWMTSHDERVRDSHKVLSDKIFSYTDLPAVGLPGTDYRCRCVATPVFVD